MWLPSLFQKGSKTESSSFIKEVGGRSVKLWRLETEKKTDFWFETAFWLSNQSNKISAEQIWCLFVLYTIRAPNTLLRDTRCCAQKFLCGNYSGRKISGNLNPILASWKSNVRLLKNIFNCIISYFPER